MLFYSNPLKFLAFSSHISPFSSFQVWNTFSHGIQLTMWRISYLTDGKVVQRNLFDLDTANNVTKQPSITALLGRFTYGSILYSSQQRCNLICHPINALNYFRQIIFGLMSHVGDNFNPFLSFKLLLKLIIWMRRLDWSRFSHSSIYLRLSFPPYSYSILTRSLLFYFFLYSDLSKFSSFILCVYTFDWKNTHFISMNERTNNHGFLNSNSLIAPLPLRNSLVYLTLFYWNVILIQILVVFSNAFTIPLQFNDLIKCVCVCVYVLLVGK